MKKRKPLPAATPVESPAVPQLCFDIEHAGARAVFCAAIVGLTSRTDGPFDPAWIVDMADDVVAEVHRRLKAEKEQKS